SIDVVNLLLDAGANANFKKEREGEIPLMTAASNGDADMVQLLLDNGANPSLRDLHGRTALRHAINKGHNSMVEI
ncbi:ankyrin, partial [Bimuria novae-zelandiae CBS 107.79]